MCIIFLGSHSTTLTAGGFGGGGGEKNESRMKVRF